MTIFKIWDWSDGWSYTLAFKASALFEVFFIYNSAVLKLTLNLKRFVSESVTYYDYHDYFLIAFSFIILLAGFMVIFSRNPIHSIFFLILAFIGVSGFVFSLHLEFLAIIFLIVYVGAISVLFLFIVMMLNIKVIELAENFFNYLPIGAFVCIFCLFLLYFYIFSNFTFTLSIFNFNVLRNSDFVCFFHILLIKYFIIQKKIFVGKIFYFFFLAKYKFKYAIYVFVFTKSCSSAIDSLITLFSYYIKEEDLLLKPTYDYRSGKYTRRTPNNTVQNAVKNLIYFIAELQYRASIVKTFLKDTLLISMLQKPLLYANYTSVFNITFVNYLNEKQVLFDIENIALLLYEHHFISFILAAFILLVAMLGAIVLTLTPFNENTHTLVRRQINALQSYRISQLKLYKN